eukprot:121950_1
MAAVYHVKFPAIYYKANRNEEYILSCSIYTGIHQYDVNKNKWSKFADYPSKFSKINLLDLKCAINKKNGKLYFYGSMDALYAIFHIESKKWDIKCCESCYKMEGRSLFSKAKKYNCKTKMNNAKTVIIDSKLHIIGTTNHTFYHLISDVKKSGNETSFVESKGIKSMNYIDILDNFELIHVNATKQLMIIGGYKYDNNNWTYSKDIWYCDLNDLQWKQSNIKLPHATDEFFAVLSYKYIVFVMYWRLKQIYCVDLIHKSKYKWYKSDFNVEFDIYCKEAACIKQNEDTIRLICFKWDGRKKDPYQYVKHVKISLLDIIPEKLKQEYVKRFKFLINGYLQVINNAYIEISSDLLCLIARYYSSL